MNDIYAPSTAPNHSLAIVSLVLGILGIIFVLPVIGSIGALLTGNIARREIRQNPGQYSGDNLARAGVILGWIGVGFSVIALVLLCLAVLFFIPVSSQIFPQ